MKFALGLLVFTVAGFVFNAAPTCAQGSGQNDYDVNWLSHYGAARHASSEAGRPVFLVMTLDDCVHCVRMKDDMQRDRRVANSLNNDFVPLMVNGASNPVLARQLRVEIYPTTVIIAPDGKVLDYMRGYLPPPSLSARIDSIIVPKSHIARRIDK